ncbi:M14 family metallopeptidase [Bacillus sp. V33-4]|uniref:M14 family metallopeptidase n=1 Tax=Bacillus sp. V33-4 TaxID=2054169 RepID=UPI000C768B5C|nr:M14 family metallopeptidase [Bacillus sp. V33-4]PLR87582.1 peptidase M14 [Bacillus sp. V33-4]
MKVRVRAGDSLWYYSQLFRMPLNLIVDSNNLATATSLQIGQEINIPGFTAVTYSVRRGDTFWRLAAARNLSVDALLLLNQTVNPNVLTIGQTVFLPRRLTEPIVFGKKPYDFNTLATDIEKLLNVYPFMIINTIGSSVLGKPIQEIKLGRGRRKVHINASFHANEWITTAILMSFLNTYLLSLTNMNPVQGVTTMNLYNSVDLSIVPMVNPDGVDLVVTGPPEEVRARVIEINRGSTDFTGWKANLRGVDLNNQFPANWEIEKTRKPKSPAPRDYPGVAPLTEPEAVVMAELARTRSFDRLLAFHTQGKEFYWGYEGLEPLESGIIANEFARVSGYRKVQYVDSHAGYKDWFIQDFRRPGFTIELGKGINPLPLSHFDEIYTDALGIFLAALYM